MVKHYLIMHFNTGSTYESIYYITERTSAKEAFKEFLKKMREAKVEASFSIEQADFYSEEFEKKGENVNSVRTLVSTLEIKDGKVVETECNIIMKENQVNIFELRYKKNS